MILSICINLALLQTWIWAELKSLRGLTIWAMDEYTRQHRRWKPNAWPRRTRSRYHICASKNIGQWQIGPSFANAICHGVKPSGKSAYNLYISRWDLWEAHKGNEKRDTDTSSQLSQQWGRKSVSPHAHYAKAIPTPWLYGGMYLISVREVDTTNERPITAPTSLKRQEAWGESPLLVTLRHIYKESALAQTKVLTDTYLD